MPAKDNPGVGLPSEAAQAGFCAILALLFVLGGDRVIGIERAFYDFCQRWSAVTATAPVVIVSPDTADQELWALPRLADLITRVKAAGATAILPAAAAPTEAGADDVSRLQSLIRLEAGGGYPRSGAEPGLLQLELAEAEQRVNQQQRVAAAVRAAGNVILGLAASERRPESDPAPEACAARIEAASARYPGLDGGRLILATLVPAAATFCEAAAAIGHLAPVADPDGVVRRPAPVLTTGPGSIPSSALAAVGLTFSPPRASDQLARFYQSPDGRPGFAVVSAADVLNGRADGELRNHYVVIGQAEASTPGRVRTPLSRNSGAAVLIATDLANYLSGEEIRRPAWAIWVEITIALGLAMMAVYSGRLSPIFAALLAASGVGLLLLAEYLLVAVAGLWLKLAALAAFTATGVVILQVLARFSGHGVRTAALGAKAEAKAAVGPGDEMDLAFSVLRQQPTTERTKLQLYELAMEHGKNRDYARAERVFRYLAARDPGYRDVAAKLEKLSGARGVPPPKPQPDRAAVASGEPPAAPSQAGQKLGRYELERVIGRGAMATVYLGRDPTINRRLAIKTMPLAEEFAEDDLHTARAHFMREAESAGRLNHPYIISIHDAGEDNNVAYLAMEYFEGKPLNHYAQLGRLLPAKVVFELMARAAEALDYAHSQNVVHRDVKPANLMYDPATDRLKLTDFGIARLTDASRTRTGIILGTPSYMSPEQLSASKVSGQTDLYSLGVTMYHLLTGSPPFQADSIPRLMDKIVNQKHRPVSDLRDDIPPCTDKILDRALAKDPADRFPTGKAMALALRECCSTFPSEIL